MTNENSERLSARYQSFSGRLAILTVFAGGFVLAGWAFHIEILKSFHPSFVAMKANTAGGFLLIGIALKLLQKNPPGRAEESLAKICAAAVALLGVLTLAEYALQRDLGIDQILFKEVAGAFGTSHPGRMSPNSALNFVLIGAALFFLDMETKSGRRPAQYLILIQGTISLTALIGYLYGIKTLYGFAAYTLMSLPTALIFILIFFGVLFARPGRGLLQLMTADNTGGMVARRFMFLVLAIPLVSELLAVAGQRAGFYPEDFKPAVHTLMIMFSLAALVWMTARLLARLDEVRRAGEELILKSEEKYRQLVEDANSIILRMDTRGCVTFMNEFAGKFFGFKGHEILGKSVVGTIVPETAASGQNLQTMIDDIPVHPDRYKNNENENICRDGRRVWISWTNRALFDAGGRVLEILCIGNDISKLKEAEAETLAAKEAAESANKAKSAFLANMSHELRTPLTAIIGFSDLMAEGAVGTLNEEQKEYIGYVQKSGKHLLSLINDILDLSKVEAGKMELALSDFDLKELLKNSFSFVMDKMNERGLYYCCEIGDGVGSVRADERKIKQVIFNLLSNAVKFTPQGGKIVLGADKKNESEILVFVRDNGIGVEAKDRDKIFSEFAQIDSEFSRKYAGTGLGMPLSRKFIELHGGRLWFESEGQGKGTTFYFTVPVTQPVSA